ncbi:uncharacterized protein A4U43_C02F4900 [Asparagus officinalis]|uniref:Uncharacterized protein n=1 Tax=Asparagus officinalis TaxID=4686 RepID=A0A5P1FFZ4_ASPOF|nr:disease resistance protein RPS2-like [Asparagus officinalis]ONK77278.1 uncharacterized protein A4U43_C02F4900 [Asparagus officinalis]
MESAKEQLENYFEGDNTNIIGVYGMAGVGKTLLLENFNNEHLQQREHHVIWVTVGDHPDHPTIEEIQVIVMERLGIHWQEIEDREQWRRAIHYCLKDKPFVLFLDDIWRHLNLHDVGIPIPEPPSKSKIILSTQVEAVCASMGAEKVFVECLNDDESFLLFSMMPGCEVGPRRPYHLKLLLKKCGGLPIAIKNIAQSVANKCTRSVLSYVITNLEIPYGLLQLTNVEFISRMKRSYDNLRTEQLKTCFLFCSLLPESVAYARESLINLLLGEEIIVEKRYDHGHEAYNSGYNLIEDLKITFLLKTNSDSDMICMHPMARVLAMWISKSEHKWLISANRKLRRFYWQEDAERISFAYNGIRRLYNIPNCPELLTLLLRRNGLNKICDGFFGFMPKLRVLDLSNNPIKELPEGIGNLVNLRYLELRSTAIRSLPMKMKDLAKLRFLILKFTWFLRVVPKHLIANLTNLRVLEMDYSFGDWKVGPTTQDGANIDEIDQLPHLKTLGITIEREDALEKLKMSPKLAISTRNLTLRTFPGLTTISLASLLKEVQHLRVLYIKSCNDLESVVIKSRRSDSKWTRLAEIQELYLSSLPKAVISWKNASITSIRKLVLEGCSKMEQLIHVEDDDDDDKEIDIFPNLERLELKEMEGLKSLNCGKRLMTLPRLTILKVMKCSNLTDITILTRQRVTVTCFASWWELLEWEDELIKSNFIPLLKPSRSFQDSDSDAEWNWNPIVAYSEPAY